MLCNYFFSLIIDLIWIDNVRKDDYFNKNYLRILTSYEAFKRKNDKISKYEYLNVFVSGCLSGV